MQVEPAHINQVTTADDGRMVEISGDVCGVAADLKQIDPKLGVNFRFSPHGAFFAVYYQPDERTTQLVLTQNAYQGETGVWLGLDQRIVERVREISSSTYDYVREVGRQNQAAETAKADRRQQRLEQAAETAHRELGRLKHKPRRK